MKNKKNISVVSFYNYKAGAGIAVNNLVDTFINSKKFKINSFYFNSRYTKFPCSNWNYNTL